MSIIVRAFVDVRGVGTNIIFSGFFLPQQKFYFTLEKRNAKILHLALKTTSTLNAQKLYQISFSLLHFSILLAACKTIGQFHLTLK